MFSLQFIPVALLSEGASTVHRGLEKRLALRHLSSPPPTHISSKLHNALVAVDPGAQEVVGHRLADHLLHKHEAGAEGDQAGHTVEAHHLVHLGGLE